MEKNVVIRVEGLSKEYRLYGAKRDRLKEALSVTNKQYSRTFHALNNISFDVRRGETVGIIGSNGSGKSTLLKILTGIIAASKGTVEINGKVSALLELGAGFNPEYTGIENIYLNGTVMGYSKEEMSAKIDSIIEFAQIGEHIHQPLKTYSSGMFARLAFAVAINVEPDVLIVDEALSVGDVFFQNKCFRKFDELKNKGVTILFVSHDVESVKQMCNRVVWIEAGEQMMFGPSREVCNAYATFILGKNNQVAHVEGELQDAYEGNAFDLTAFPAVTEYGNESILSNDVEICAFYFQDANGKPIYSLDGGESYKLVLMFRAAHALENVIAGFVLQTKKGLILINSNSLVTGKKTVFNVEGKGLYRVEFSFKLPYLASDEYILDCAVAQGTTVNESKMLTWLYGALRIFVHNPLGDLGLLDIDADVNIYTKREK